MTTTERESVPTTTRPDARTVLQTVWIFATLNYIYCDVIGLMHTEQLREFLAGEAAGIEVTEGFLLGASALVEIPIAMVLVVRLAPYRIARVASIAAGTVMTVVQTTTLFVGELTPYYAFFSAIEIAATAFVVWYAWRWRPGADARG